MRLHLIKRYPLIVAHALPLRRCNTQPQPHNMLVELIAMATETLDMTLGMFFLPGGRVFTSRIRLQLKVYSIVCRLQPQYTPIIPFKVYLTKSQVGRSPACFFLDL